MHKFLILSLLVLFGLFVGSASAASLSLDEAKAQGLVGETPSGYLEAVSASPANEVASLVSNINSERKKEYERIAEKRDTALTIVETLAGKTAVEKTAAGNYVKVDGRWLKK